MHWIHHSREPAEHNRNLGAVFSGWDRLFGTYVMGASQSQIIFGLDEYASTQDVTLVRFYRMPLIPGAAVAGHNELSSYRFDGRATWGSLLVANPF
jgi:hypothetical protein